MVFWIKVPQAYSLTLADFNKYYTDMNLGYSIDLTPDQLTEVLKDTTQTDPVAFNLHNNYKDTLIIARDDFAV